MATLTTAARLAAIEASIAALVSAITPTPATAAPVREEKASAAFGGLTFTAYVAKRTGERVACAIHEAGTCNRTFSPKSSGNTSHEARIV